MSYYTPSYGYTYNMNSMPQQIITPSYPQPQPQTQGINMLPQQQPQQQIQGLNGKIVDGEDVVRATEVPIGGYGIFPRADLAEVYIKTWNNNGTTSVVTYKPVVPEPTQDLQQQESKNENNNSNNEIIQILIQKIDNMESKINKIDEILTVPKNININKPLVKQQEVIKNGF